jgi:hypothetical protein
MNPMNLPSLVQAMVLSCQQQAKKWQWRTNARNYLVVIHAIVDVSLFFVGTKKHSLGLLTTVQLSRRLLELVLS